MIVTKVFGILCAVLCVVEAFEIKPEEKEMIMKLTEKCRKMNNASEEDMNSFLGGAMPMSKAIKCTLTCAMQEYQIAEEKAGKLQLNVQKMMNFAKSNGVNRANITMIEKIGEKCKSPKVTDKCDFCVEVAKCVMIESATSKSKPKFGH